MIKHINTTIRLFPRPYTGIRPAAPTGTARGPEAANRLLSSGRTTCLPLNQHLAEGIKIMPVRTQLGSIPLVTVSNRLLAKGHEMAATMLHTREYGMTSHPLGHRRRRESHLIEYRFREPRHTPSPPRPHAVPRPSPISEPARRQADVSQNLSYCKHTQKTGVTTNSGSVFSRHPSPATSLSLLLEAYRRPPRMGRQSPHNTYIMRLYRLGGSGNFAANK